jgi:hypothetical protein
LAPADHEAYPVAESNGNDETLRVEMFGATRLDYRQTGSWTGDGRPRQQRVRLDEHRSTSRAGSVHQLDAHEDA